MRQGWRWRRPRGGRRRPRGCTLWFNVLTASHQVFAVDDPPRTFSCSHCSFAHECAKICGLGRPPPAWLTLSGSRPLDRQSVSKGDTTFRAAKTWRDGNGELQRGCIQSIGKGPCSHVRFGLRLSMCLREHNALDRRSLPFPIPSVSSIQWETTFRSAQLERFRRHTTSPLA